MSTIEVNRLRHSADEATFTCPLCHNVLCDPVQRPNCNHVYCKKCIGDYLKSHSSCPLDDSPLTVNYLSNISDSFKCKLNSIELKCKYSSNGCTRWIKYVNLHDHESICLFRNIDTTISKKGNIEQMLRTRLLCPTGLTTKSTNSYMVKLLQILEEKEQLVKQQEQLISAIIDESDEVTRLMEQITTQSSSELSNAIKLISKLEDENKQLRHRVSLNQDKLVTVAKLPRSQTTYDTSTLLDRTRGDMASERATSALGHRGDGAIGGTGDGSSSSFDMSPIKTNKFLTCGSTPSPQLTRSPSARFYHTSGHRRKLSGRSSHSSYGNRGGNEKALVTSKSCQRPSTASNSSPKKSLRRASYCSTSFSSRISTATVEHLEVVRRLKPRLSEPVYRAIQVVDLADFYDFDPYQLTWAAYVADRIKRFASHIKEGNRVLLISGWNDVYIAVTLAVFVGSKGALVTRSSVPVFASLTSDTDRINRNHSYLLQRGQLVLLPHDSPNFTSNGYRQLSPFDVIFVSSSLYNKDIDAQRNQESGIVFDPYENKDITGTFHSIPVTSTPTSPSIHISSEHSSDRSSSLSNRSTDGEINQLLLHSK